MKLKNTDGHVIYEDEGFTTIKELAEGVIRLGRQNFAFADFSGADLTGLIMTHCDLANSNFCGANLTNANLFGSNLSYSNFYKTNLENANLEGADMETTIFDSPPVVSVPKKIRYRNRDYLGYIKHNNCIVGYDCIGDVVAHHSKSRGAGGSDLLAVSLCMKHHNEIHAIGTNTFAGKYGIDINQIIVELLSKYLEINS